MKLDPQAIGIPLVPMNQKAPKSSGPVGRIETMTNAVVQKLQNGGIKIQKADGMAKVTKQVRDVTAFSPDTTNGVPGCRLLTEVANSSLEIGSDSLVYTLGNDAWNQWQQPVFPNGMRRTPIFDGNTISDLPDGTAVGSVAAYCFRAHRPPNASTGAGYIQFQDLQKGVTMSLPDFSYCQGTSVRQKVVSDGVHFWQFFDHNNGTPASIGVNVWDANGNLIAGTTVDTLHIVGDHWDVTYDSSVGVCFARIANSFGVVLSKLTISGTTITVVTNTNSTAGSRGGSAPFNDYGIAFLQSREADGFVYVASFDVGDNGFSLHVVRMSGTAVTNHDYDVYDDSYEYLFTMGISNITGFVIPGTTSVHVTWTQMPLGATIANMNVQTRSWIQTVAGVTPATHTTVTKLRSCGLASRAFFLENRWVEVVYYPSTSAPGGASNQFAQTTFFLHDILTNKICGCFEWATAAQDWVFAGWTGTIADSIGQPFPDWFSLPSGFIALGLHVPLATRGTSFNESIPSPFGIGTLNVFTSTVGITDEFFGQPGSAVAYAGELLLPGPSAESFGGADLGEINFQLNAEQPSSVLGGGGGLTTNQTYQVVLVEEWTNTQGQRVKGSPSIALSVPMGSNTSIALTWPTDRVTQHAGSIWSVYSTYLVAGVMSTVHAKVTNDLSPVYNRQDVDTLTFTITQTDAQISVGEPLYTDGINPPFGWRRSPAPFNCGTTINDNVVLGCYDNALWISFSKVEGEAISFNSTRRIPMPTSDPIIALQAFDNHVLIQCQNSSWYIDGSGWPTADGNGSWPTPIFLPFTVGCAGASVMGPDGVYFASTDNRLWFVRRDLTDDFIGAPVEDDTLTSAILGCAVDQDQRVWVLLSGNLCVIYDTITGCWYRRPLPTTSAQKIGTYQGRVVIADAANAQSWIGTPGSNAWVDDTAPLITSVQFVPMAFAGVPGLQMVWELQFLGEALGRHTLTITVIYDDGTTQEESRTFDSANLGIASGAAYRWTIPLYNPECQAVAVRLVDSFPNGASAGFTLENIGAEVGIIPGTGKLPFSQTILPSTPGAS